MLNKIGKVQYFTRAVSSIPCISSLASASVRSLGIFADGINIAAVSVGRAFVDICKKVEAYSLSMWLKSISYLFIYFIFAFIFLTVKFLFSSLSLVLVLFYLLLLI